MFLCVDSSDLTDLREHVHMLLSSIGYNPLITKPMFKAASVLTTVSIIIGCNKNKKTYPSRNVCVFVFFKYTTSYNYGRKHKK